MSFRGCLGSRLPRFAAFAASTLAFVFGAPSAAAQDMPRTFELTPYAAYRFGGQFEPQAGTGRFDLREGPAEGLMLDISAANVNSQWEILYGHQSTKVETQPGFASPPLLALDVEYLHFGGTYLFQGEGVRPFIAMTIGVARFDPRGSSFGSDSYFSASLGGGVQLRAEKRVGVRLEGRVFGTLVNNDGDVFCATGGIGAVCALRIDGDVLYQWEGRAGVVFRF